MAKILQIISILVRAFPQEKLKPEEVCVCVSVFVQHFLTEVSSLSHCGVGIDAIGKDVSLTNDCFVLFCFEEWRQALRRDIYKI